MGNCLVTKLKESVDNNDLLKLGEFRVKVIGGHASFNSAKKQTLTALNGDLLIDGQTSKEVPAWQNFSSFTGTGILSFSDVYNIRQLIGILDGFSIGDLQYCNGLFDIGLGEDDASYNPTDINIDLSDVAKLSSLTSFRIFNNTNYIRKITGDFSSLRGNSLISDLTITGLGTNSAVTGTLYDFGTLTAISKYHYTIGAFTKITGSIEDFVRGKRDFGVTEGSATFGYLNYNNKFTFNGEVFANVADNNLSWTANTITFNGTTINA